MAKQEETSNAIAGRKSMCDSFKNKLNDLSLSISIVNSTIMESKWESTSMHHRVAPTDTAKLGGTCKYAEMQSSTEVIEKKEIRKMKYYREFYLFNRYVNIMNNYITDT